MTINSQQAMTETSTQAAPAPLQVRVKELDRLLREIVFMRPPGHTNNKMIVRMERTAMNAIEVLADLALDLSTPTQIAALEAENVKLRAERDEARDEAQLWETRAIEASRHPSDGAIYSSVSWQQEVKRLEAEVARLTEALKNLSVEMRHFLRTNPKKDGGLYRQRLAEAEATLQERPAAEEKRP